MDSILSYDGSSSDEDLATSSVASDTHKYCSSESLSLLTDSPLTASRKRKLSESEVDTNCGSADYFSLSANSESEDETISIKPKLKSKQTPLDSSETLTAQFWSNEDEDITDWEKSHQIWSLPSCVKESESTDRTLSSQSVTCASGKSSSSQRGSAVNQVRSRCERSAVDSHRNIFATSSKVNYYLVSANTTKCKGHYPKRKTADIDCKVGIINRIQWSAPCFSHLIASANASSSVSVWSCLEASNNAIRCVQTLSHHTKAVRDLAWTHCGRSIASCGFDKTAIIADVETGKA